jgi:RNA polymerase sigma-70 factor (ECF subfamily)
MQRPHLKLVEQESVPQTRNERLEALFTANVSYLSSIGWSILGNREDVQDLLQDLFVLALRKLRDLEVPQAVSVWFSTAAVRLARRRLYRRRFLPFWSTTREDGSEMELHAVSPTPEQRILLKSVFRVLDEVPVPARLAWSLRVFEQMNLATVAELCDCSLATAKRRIAVAQRAIDEALGHA